jgi:hypothetical protein
MDYYVWYDESAQKTSAQKIHEAIAAYQLRFTRVPQLVLVHSADQAQIENIVIRSEQTVQRNSFWLGI